ncbi:hypothetical protein [Pelagicoccus sp. SDUM812002]|nr:hypothetical protein [Pelagicoccus sp. SDUM812002]MDQ8188051.1 hypothetical protein [Pelagicoccus sp. SDUM812002]
MERTLPVRLRASMLEETAKIYTPLGYAPDEFVLEKNNRNRLL